MGKLKKPLRKNVALAIDGGGLKGVMVARALMKLEEATGKSVADLFGLTVGTSTGTIISAGIAHGMNAESILEVYRVIGPQVFIKSWRSLPLIKFFVNYQYRNDPLKAVFKKYLGDMTLGELHKQRPKFHMVITTTDVYASETRFIKLSKMRYADWMLRDATLASCTVPTIFPVYQHDYKKQGDDPKEEDWIPEQRYFVDGGTGSYSNPCYMAAYEIAFCMAAEGWDLSNTTLISVGTGRDPLGKVWERRRRELFGIRRKLSDLAAAEWAHPIIEILLRDADLQQIRLVRHFFSDSVAARAGKAEAGLDFRRFNINFTDPIALDDLKSITALERYGDQLGDMIVNNVQEDAGDFACADAIPLPTPKAGKKIAQAI
jgi:hypothetical protein